MSQASIDELSPGVFQLSGVIDYSSGPQLRKEGGKLLKACNASTCVIDCGAVEKSSSVGLSLLLAFMRDAQSKGKSLEVRNLPKDMQEIAKVSELLEILSGQQSPGATSPTLPSVE
ncbi:MULTISPECIES: STAS domain-containing protein [Pseudomonas]|uniref:Phospholipid transport system transporter-binding protein n=1 Tax=Pseudomonas segetis TaxID=298908 RepID=A0A239CYJ7_9PSED|nr:MULTISPECIES: STAS domain-containing protein [Pseudomonas]SNS25180.1 phospholipid transport system transporter-binding protein [Pseudomonas segetis]